VRSICAATASTNRLDLLIGVDVSGSIRRERLPQALDFIADVVDDLEIGPDKTRIALVYYSDDAYLLFDYDRFSSKDDIFYWIRRTPYIGGRTNSAAALRLMVIIILTLISSRLKVISQINYSHKSMRKV